MSNTVTPTDQTPTQPWGDLPATSAEPVHYWTAIGMVACTSAIATEIATSVAEAVTCAHCLAAMTAPITEDHGPVPAPEPDLSTPEARWAFALTLWHTHSLPTPGRIAVGYNIHGIHIELADNAREYVDRWAAALGVADVKLDGSQYNVRGHVNGVYVRAFCDIDEQAPNPQTPELVDAANRVITMLNAATSPTEDELAGALAWLNAQPVNAALFNAILDQPWCSSVTEPAGGLPDDVELVDGRRLVRTDNGWQLATSDGVR